MEGACACLRGLTWHPGTHAQAPSVGPTWRPSDQENLVPRAENMVPPYFEGVESMSGFGLTQFQGFKGDLGRKPENATKIGSKFLAGTIKIGWKSPGSVV